MLDSLNALDRRWVFLAMGLTIAAPILLRISLREQPTEQSRSLFAVMEELPRGSKILISLDYEPATAGELSPMTTAFLRHCCLRGYKMCLMTTWPNGLPLLDQNIRKTIIGEFGDLHLKYGSDYVNLGYAPGEAVAIKLVANDLRAAFPNDNAGNRIDDLPMLKDIHAARDFALVLDVTAGYPGGKEWVQYAGTQGVQKIAIGSVGVQVPLLAPYYPNQIVGLLAAIKGAAEYESLLVTRYPEQIKLDQCEGTRRMGPQLYAHLLMVMLIILGNVIHFGTRRRSRA